MDTDNTNNTDVVGRKVALIHGDLTYRINGILFAAHKELGPYAREKQYSKVVARMFKERGMGYEAEVSIGDSGNIVDGIVEKLVLLEFKAKRILTPEDYYQIQRYLQETNLRLGILVNFRDKLIRPKRVVKIENWKDKK